jgi:hypothetical protein
MTEVPARDALSERALHLLRANTRTGRKDGREYVFTIPAVRAYPFQWFWDSCFHSIVWSRFDRERAAEEIRSLLAWQRPNGLVPHVVFWDHTAIKLRAVWHHLESHGLPCIRRPVTTEYVQPPVLAQAVERIGGDFAREALPAVAGFYRYLARERDPDRDGLVSIVAQFESGIDFSPAYGVRRPSPAAIYFHGRYPEIVNKLLGFRLERIFERTDHHQEDVLFNAVYGDGLRSLARLASAGGDDDTAAWARSTADRVTEALVERCWDAEAGLFFNLVGRRERRVTERTILSLLPLLLPDLPAAIASRLAQHALDPDSFWTSWPIASVPPGEAGFSPDSRVGGFRFIWRGPCSMNTNWLLARGLRRHGHEAAAKKLAERSRQLVERHGFNEFYNPLDGTPVGAQNFGWATLAIDM